MAGVARSEAQEVSLSWKAYLYIATGDSGNGMSHGTIAGILLTDLILERSNAWVTLYDPSRVTLRAAGEFARENLLTVVYLTIAVATRGRRSVHDYVAGTFVR